ncbi:DUF1659 domain-containing protein [Alkalibacter mobilis]|uniref:DUF1659 domain-containing protein n=1 Tax=Alkalibacter mobilis TaxID=2787712 RepID=UPI00189F108E|nr:DUF1659 domain-containing protein [Alkalibacter mobilis]MBF7096137.1 DUF1659 domain-containing protein [Alkalibacter mobilis]
MAVESSILSTKMVLKLNGGTDEKGEPIVRSKTYSNVNTQALDQDVYDVAAGMAALQTNPFEGVHKVEETILVNL